MSASPNDLVTDNYFADVVSKRLFLLASYTHSSSSPYSQVFLVVCQGCIDLEADPFSTRLNWHVDDEDDNCAAISSWPQNLSGYHERKPDGSPSTDKER